MSIERLESESAERRACERSRYGSSSNPSLSGAAETIAVSSRSRYGIANRARVPRTRMGPKKSTVSTTCKPALGEERLSGDSTGGVGGIRTLDAGFAHILP